MRARTLFLRDGDMQHCQQGREEDYTLGLDYYYCRRSKTGLGCRVTELLKGTCKHIHGCGKPGTILIYLISFLNQYLCKNHDWVVCSQPGRKKSSATCSPVKLEVVIKRDSSERLDMAPAIPAIGGKAIQENR